MNKRNTQKVLRVIESSIATLRNKNNWVQFSSAQDENGMPAITGSSQACKFCVTGAMKHFSRVQASASDPIAIVNFISDAAQKELTKALRQVSHREVARLTAVNDFSRNAHARILRGLRGARANLRKTLANA